MVAETFYTLGIHDGHNSGAALCADGQVVAAVCEERLTRRKNEVGYPRLAIEDCLRLGGIDASRLGGVVYASNFMHTQSYLADITPWYGVGLAEQRAAEATGSSYQRIIFDQRRNERIADVVEHLGVAEGSVEFVEHHPAHLAAAYYTAPWRQPGEPILSLTCDGAGDGLAATVSICRDNDIERIAATDRHASLGKVYSRLTFMMGMTPWEHEYKLMGMAPYAHSERVDSALAPLHQLLRLSDDGLRFEQAGELSTNFSYEYLRDAFERVRFDTICGAAQRFTEEMLVAWVKACVAKTGIRKIVAGGGVFMNVKANMLIAALPEVERLYVMPTSGDESLSIGAAMHQFYTRTGEADHRRSALTDLYFGGEATVREEEQAIAAAGTDLDVRQTDDMPGAVADLLAAGEIVANCRGRMEWGARSLGNRSILASADEFGRIGVINRMIKMRDFWMPFAPSMTDQSSARYFDDPKDLKPWFMTFAYAAKDAGYDHLIAGSHPHDRTIRPQVVTRRANPDYHAVIEKFEAKTGRGVVLNTSFNLHGEPIVYGPADAMRVLLTSGLEHLALNNFIVSKKSV